MVQYRLHRPISFPLIRFACVVCFISAAAGFFPCGKLAADDFDRVLTEYIGEERHARKSAAHAADDMCLIEIILFRGRHSIGSYMVKIQNLIVRGIQADLIMLCRNGVPVAEFKADTVDADGIVIISIISYDIHAESYQTFG